MNLGQLSPRSILLINIDLKEGNSCFSFTVKSLTYFFDLLYTYNLQNESKKNISCRFGLK